MRRFLARCTGLAVVGFARALTGVRAYWTALGRPRAVQTLYFANHSSHADFVLVWATLPPELRATTRPVAAADYWATSGLRRFIGAEVFRAVLIDRVPRPEGPDPVRQMADALVAGDSLIMFPEGTRNTGDEPLLPLKSGLYRLARECPTVRMVPVWIENLKRVLPKGAVVPLPLACTVRYGDPLDLHADEDKAAFLGRARAALLALRPEYERQEVTA
jgi:1-acyl-sn-glycerol-3-phosphate acyltransferase